MSGNAIQVSQPSVLSNISPKFKFARIVVAPENTALRCTVYVGNIPSCIDDPWLRSLFEELQPIVRWSRTSDPISGKRGLFGFCEFISPEGAYLAHYCLNGVKLGPKELLVKIQQKALPMVETWKTKTLKDALLTSPDSTLAEVEAAFNEMNNEKLTIIKQLIDEKVEQSKDLFRPAESSTVTAESHPRKPKTASTPKISDPKKDKYAEKLEMVSKYLSKGYYQHRLEISRLRRLDDQEKLVEKEFNQKMKQYSKEEEQRIKNLSRKIPFDAIISEMEKRKYIEKDKAGVWWEGLKSYKVRMRRRKKRLKEIEEDEIDRKEEEKEQIEEELKRNEELKAQTEIQKLEEEIKMKLGQNEPTVVAKQEGAQKPAYPGVTNYTHAFVKTPGPSKVKREAIKPLDIFQTDIEDTEDSIFKLEHKPLTLIPRSADKKDKQSLIEQAKRIYEQIPQDKEKLFEHPIKWNIILQHKILETKLNPWISKKMIQFMGTDESVVKDVVNFIIQSLKSETVPEDLLSQVEVFLDEDAETFVRTLWRMLIFEQIKAEQNKNNDIVPEDGNKVDIDS